MSAIGDWNGACPWRCIPGILLWDGCSGSNVSDGGGFVRFEMSTVLFDVTAMSALYTESSLKDVASQKRKKCFLEKKRLIFCKTGLKNGNFVCVFMHDNTWNASLVTEVLRC